MNKTCTLVLGILCIALAFPARMQAQFYQSFDQANQLGANNCWSFDGFFLTYDRREVINGTASLYSNPPTNSSSYRDLVTPYLNVSSTSFSVSFAYRLSAGLNGQSVRTIELGLLDAANNYTMLDVVTMNAATVNPTQVRIYNRAFTLSGTGHRRLVMRMGGDQGSGGTRQIIDDLRASASALYGNGSCNSAPSAANDSYYGTSGARLMNGSVLDNDTDPDKESLEARLVSQSPDGTVVLEPNGNFTFTPNPGFSGTSTQFTYLARDNGAGALQSNIATVTLFFAVGGVMPVQLTHFAGNRHQGRPELEWSVSGNEDADSFTLERSSNGRDFGSVLVVLPTTTKGNQSYRFADQTGGSGVQYYRLKISDRSGLQTYSSTVVVYAAATAPQPQLTVWQMGGSAISLKFEATHRASCTITLTDLQGRLLGRQQLASTAGSNRTTLQLPARLGQGVYLVRVQNSQHQYTGKIWIP